VLLSSTLLHRIALTLTLTLHNIEVLTSTVSILQLAGDGLPDMATQDEVLKALKTVGFEVQGPLSTSIPHSVTLYNYMNSNNVIFETVPYGPSSGNF
jgi:hypothetical protein